MNFRNNSAQPWYGWRFTLGDLWSLYWNSRLPMALRRSGASQVTLSQHIAKHPGAIVPGLPAMQMRHSLSHLRNLYALLCPNGSRKYFGKRVSHIKRARHCDNYGGRLARIPCKPGSDNMRASTFPGSPAPNSPMPNLNGFLTNKATTLSHD